METEKINVIARRPVESECFAHQGHVDPPVCLETGHTSTKTAHKQEQLTKTVSQSPLQC